MLIKELCEKYDGSVVVFKKENNPGGDSGRANVAVGSMREARERIETRVDFCMRWPESRHDELSFFSAWLLRRGWWS